MSVLKRISTPSLLCILSKDDRGASRYTIIVSTKIQKSAVKRNRIKRIIRAALTQILPTLPPPIHYVIVVKKDCSMKKTQDMIKELEVLKTL